MLIEHLSLLRKAYMEAASILQVERAADIALFFQLIKEAGEFTHAYALETSRDLLDHQGTAFREDIEHSHLFWGTMHGMLKLVVGLTYAFAQKHHKVLNTAGLLSFNSTLPRSPHSLLYSR